MKGYPKVNFDFITGNSDLIESGGILKPIIGTVYITSLAIFFAFPIGIFSAIFISEYIRKSKLSTFIENVTLNLSGVPSIVYGLFGLSIFVTLFGFKVSILSGALTLACMALPIIIIVSYHALLSVPNDIREASYALGANKIQTVFFVILPNVFSHILTGVILATSRIIGETAPLLFTAAVYYINQIPNSIFDKTMVLSYHLYTISTQVVGVDQNQQYGIALVLLIIVFLFNFFSSIIRIYQKK